MAFQRYALPARVAPTLTFATLLRPPSVHTARCNTLPADGGFYSGAFARGQPAAGPGVFVFANGNKQSGQWIAQVIADALLWPFFYGILTFEQKEEGAEEDAPPKLVWISDAEANIWFPISSR
jgi:hypothetical protein